MFCRPALARHVGKAHVEMLGHAALDLVDRDRAARFLLQDVLEQVLDLLRGRARLPLSDA